ncbi:hypothetical protein BDZ94DRAFT_1258040 [Collybia nuda]|uniref:Uncharacterized protein n=1 Tax=Collybia nuda TaxID=64659 RepID=A0A9P6CFC3_9AGAR|nr:hypothetical protein BDZ94DRAFT_1258040 [Collybia nuda]
MRTGLRRSQIWVGAVKLFVLVRSSRCLCGFVVSILTTFKPDKSSKNIHPTILKLLFHKLVPVWNFVIHRRTRVA